MQPCDLVLTTKISIDNKAQRSLYCGTQQLTGFLVLDVLLCGTHWRAIQTMESTANHAYEQISFGSTDNKHRRGHCTFFRTQQKCYTTDGRTYGCTSLDESRNSTNFRGQGAEMTDKMQWTNKRMEGASERFNIWKVGWVVDGIRSFKATTCSQFVGDWRWLMMSFPAQMLAIPTPTTWPNQVFNTFCTALQFHTDRYVKGKGSPITSKRS